MLRERCYDNGLSRCRAVTTISKTGTFFSKRCIILYEIKLFFKSQKGGFNTLLCTGLYSVCKTCIENIKIYMTSFLIINDAEKNPLFYSKTKSFTFSNAYFQKS